MVDIVKADLADPVHARALVDVLDVYACDIMGGGTPLSAFTRANLAAELGKRAGVHVFLAFDGQQAVGLANCIEGFSSFACKPLLNIHDLAVTPAARGQCIGRRLIERVVQEARALGCCKVTLEVLEGNAVAQSLYRATGFAGYELKAESGRAMFMQKVLD
ncbi:GNAT family N-acetyltransferase [Herbaspirillum sp. alder98]|uniref:GNAT family N-acetyltransferase n=1 Tax=Herbaspirillum sp. alder98 TaxID=2913096 RepID=UPI001CD856D4|nr:GNAT family N-acetyltransferase [Herbaspirillum sp. alder98]MCA1325424.1 GNAT family N-acetyltransferase [Herbaspirillum sp. alder98]